MALQCDTCWAGDLTYGAARFVPLSKVRLPAGSGCQKCELELYGVRNVTRVFQHPPSDELVTVAFDHSLVEVLVTDEQSLSQPGLESMYLVKVIHSIRPVRNSRIPVAMCAARSRNCMNKEKNLGQNHIRMAPGLPKPQKLRFNDGALTPSLSSDRCQPKRVI
jgi:hypothetical protein